MSSNNVIVGLFLLTLIGGFVFMFAWPRERDQMFHFHADGNQMVGAALSAREYQGSYVVSAFVAIAQNRAGWTVLNAQRLRAVCGALLTRGSLYASRKFERSDVYRVELTVNSGRRRDTDNDVTIPISVRDGRCIAPVRTGSYRLSMPGVLRGWDIALINLNADARRVIVTFDPGRGQSYSDLINGFDPVLACQAALDEKFKSGVTPIASAAVDEMQVQVRNQRGNAIFSFFTSRGWIVSIVGNLCTNAQSLEG